MTPDSVISSSRSFPSRVRSPTPEKTDTPPCSRATLWINSWISTVLPTPAPPKRPTLPPRTYGAIRSTTLRPVSKISIAGERSPNAGGSRWMGQRSPFDGSLPSTGSPITFQMRPSAAPRAGCRKQSHFIQPGSRSSVEPATHAKLGGMADTDVSATPFTGRTAWTRNLQSPLRAFLRTETGSAAVLLAGVVAALIWANADLGSYERVWTTTLSIRIGGAGVSQDLRGWIDTGLMAFFFFVI